MNNEAGAILAQEFTRSFVSQLAGTAPAGESPVDTFRSCALMAASLVEKNYPGLTSVAIGPASMLATRKMVTVANVASGHGRDTVIFS